MALVYKFHDLEEIGSIHIPHDLEYTNQTNRLAGTDTLTTTLLTKHIGRIAKQLDDSSYWVLTAITPSIAWNVFTSVPPGISQLNKYLKVVSDGASGVKTSWETVSGLSVVDITTDQVAEPGKIYNVTTSTVDVTVTLPDPTTSDFFCGVIKASSISTPPVLVTTVSGSALIGSLTTQTIYDEAKGITVYENVSEYVISQDSRGAVQNKLARSSGILDGIDITQATTTTINISAGTYTIEDPTSLKNPSSVILQYQGVSGLTVTNLATPGYTLFKIDAGGTVTQELNGSIDAEDWRLNPYIGYVSHIAGDGNIGGVFGSHCPAQNPGSRLSTLFTGLGRFKNGMAVTPNGANMQLDIAAGTIFGPGINGAGTHNMDPDSQAVATLTPVSTIIYFTRSSIPSISTAPALYDAVNYNPTGSTVSPVGGGVNDAAIHRVYKASNGDTAIQYGQNIYTSPTAAITALFNGADTFEINPILANIAICVGYIIAQRAETDLQNSDFYVTDRFGDVAGTPSSAGGLLSDTFAIVENQTELDSAITEGKTTIFVSTPITISSTTSPAAPSALNVEIRGQAMSVADGITWTPSVANFEFYCDVTLIGNPA